MRGVHLWMAVCFGFSIIMVTAQATSVSQEQEDEMKAALRSAIDTMVDTDGFRFLTGGIMRACFHDCLGICDGCIHLDRKTQSGNNGLEITWNALKTMWDERFTTYCSRADFLALACVVVTDYTMEKGVQVGSYLMTKPPRLQMMDQDDSAPACSDTIDDGINECRPPMKVLWGRQTCSNPAAVPKRRVPSADANPYNWFAINMNLTPRETVCIMGSHSLGKLRSNETGFQGSYTTRDEVLDNEFFKLMVDPGMKWTQQRRTIKVDDDTQFRFQWEDPSGKMTRVNADMQLVYDFGLQSRRINCTVTPMGEAPGPTDCPIWDNLIHFVKEMADNNKVFLKCFTDVMDKLMHTGYLQGELVPTSFVIKPDPVTLLPPPGVTEPARPIIPTRSPQRPRNRFANRKPRPPGPRRNRNRPRNRQRPQRRRQPRQPSNPSRVRSQTSNLIGQPLGLSGISNLIPQI